MMLRSWSSVVIYVSDLFSEENEKEEEISLHERIGPEIRSYRQGKYRPIQYPIRNNPLISSPMLEDP
jgi:hypothetical protein